uniref:Succinate dehydrogenase hydrophobic membrane anchor subunit n=1 Tax=Candidatus Kentrum sp. TUN TaxID=2126343 RepID=A0A450ZS56_9GAMM|nr:MAG: succinate dehydrogenase / fumarate reductase membrane anchor subunit [Candidatus Kentron sp. TUN]VFK51747.1 MAG: succinate dehydrogenase / fumarate reductase membrane anchor subunit [Candidatus Kentron sp. TUN]VFK56612.1 MAG: succinate dehydrogenase / fumarate reductase membrane anchor subunit [Candidatus Kentron sp. TUN]
MSLRAPLAQVRGLGSAKEGAHHWWMQRITAGMLVPLFVWFVATMVVLATGSHTEAVEFFRSPIAAGASLMLIAAVFYHAALGLQVVIEDYMSAEGVRIGVIFLMRFVMILLTAISMVAIFSVAMGG